MDGLPTGSLFAGYRIEGILGRGGMGVIYRATELRPERTVALKVVAPELAPDDGFRARFLREAQIAAEIEHPHVVPVLRVGEEDGLLFIAMRYIRGSDLAALVAAEERLDPLRAARIVDQVAYALDAAHERGLVHRDVKPANVLIARDRRGEHAYLADFGLTKLAAGSKITGTGMMVGTVDYMPPEQFEGGPVDARADVYALGCVLFQILTGGVPYPRETVQARIFAHLTAPPPVVSELFPSVPIEFDEIVRRALAKRPDKRYLSAGDLGRAALAAAEGRSVTRPERSVATGAAQPKVAVAVAGHPALAPGAEDKDDDPPGRSERRAAAAIAETVSDEAPSSAAATPEAQNTLAAGLRPVSQRTRRFPLIIGAICALGALAATVIVLVGSGGSPPKAPASPPYLPARVIAPAIRVGRVPVGVAVGEGGVWVTNLGNKLGTHLKHHGTVMWIDGSAGKLIGAPIRVGVGPVRLVIADGAVWVTNNSDKTVTRINASSGNVIGRPIKVGTYPSGIAFGDGDVWVANFGLSSVGTVTRINARSGKVIGPPISVEDSPEGIAFGDGDMWVTNSSSNTVTRIDARSGKVIGSPIDVGKVPGGIAFGQGFMWVVNSGDNTVTRIDARTGSVVGDPIKVGNTPGTVAVGLGSVWVTNYRSNTKGPDTVSRIDPRSGKVIGSPIQVGNRPSGIAVGLGYVWVVNQGDDSVSRIQP